MGDRRYPTRPWVSAHVIIFNSKNEIILTKRASPPKQNYWFPPGGAIDLGETVVEGIKREVMEECNLTITDIEYLQYIDAITKDENNKILFHYVVHIYKAILQGGNLKAQDDALDVKWFSLNELNSSNYKIPEEFFTIMKANFNNLI